MMEQKIRSALLEAFSPCELDIINDSHKHAGHGSSPQTGESHFTVRLHSNAFMELTKVKQHQLVYTVLTPLFQEGLHALSLDLGPL